MIQLLSVTPIEHVDHLTQCGFRSAGRCNKYTATLMRVYEKLDNAVLDAKELPVGCVWSIEQFEQRR